MGPGPSDVHPRVLKGMSTPLVNHLDPSFVGSWTRFRELLRYTFRTDNQWTIPVSGTGSASMEAAIGNLVEPGDTMLVPTNGYFGGRMKSMAERAGGEVVEVSAPWGEPSTRSMLSARSTNTSRTCSGSFTRETSTGVLQPNVPELTDIAHDHDALVIADSVTSLGGVELRVDEWDIDVAYSGPQKCLSCPPGASPLTLNDRAMDKVLGREAAPLVVPRPPRFWRVLGRRPLVPSHCADLQRVRASRGAPPRRRGGIEARWARHRAVAGDLKAGLQDLGLG